MNIQLTLKELYLGETDGEVEAAKDNFEDLFCDEESKYEEIMSDMKFMIIGRKGTGKTYLAKYMCKNHPNPKQCKWINSADYNIEKLIYIDDMNANSSINYAYAKWFILKKMADILINEYPIASKYNPLNRRRRLYKLFSQYEDANLFKVIKKHQELAKSISTEAKGNIKNGNSLKATNYHEDKTVIELERKKFFELLSSIQNEIVKAISDKDNILLILDDLDVLDKKLSDNPIENDSILQFINVAKELNSFFIQLNKKVKIVLLIRTDILSRLQVYDNNLSKTVTSCSVDLYWIIKDIEQPEQHPLMKMVLHKARTSGNIPEEVSDEELYKYLFPEKIAGKTPLEYLLDYGQGRPRDIILYLNHIKTMYPNRTYFSATSFKDAAAKYSSDYYDSIVNEACYLYDSKFIETSMKFISSIKKTSFTLENIRDYYNSYKRNYPKIKDINTVLTFLYDVGVIGNYWEERKRRYSSWSYRIDSMGQIDFSKRFLLHYGVRKKFSL